MPDRDNRKHEIITIGYFREDSLICSLWGTDQVTICKGKTVKQEKQFTGISMSAKFGYK